MKRTIRNPKTGVVKEVLKEIGLNTLRNGERQGS
jgi:hypothetical protein